MSFSSITPSTRAVAPCFSATTSGVLPRRATSSTAFVHFLRITSALRLDVALHRIGRALADLAIGQVDTAHARLRGEAEERRVQRRHVALANVEALFREHDDTAAFGRFVGERRELRGVREIVLGQPGAGMNADAWRLPSVIVPVLSSSSTSTSPAASTARPEVAITFACIMRLMPATPIADSKPPMVVGIRQTSSATSAVMVTDVPCFHAADREHRERQQGRRGEQQHERERDEQDRQRDLVRRLLTLGAFDHRDHAVEKRLAGIDRHAHHDPVRQDARAARHRGEVAARLADHRRGFAGDRDLVDRGDAFDHFTVGGNHVAGFDQHDIALAQIRRVQRSGSATWDAAGSASSP